MDVNYGCPQNKGYGRDICLADSATTHTILQDRKYFSKLMLTKAKVTTISGPANLIEGSGRAQIMLPNGTILSIPDALYSSNSRRNLLSFKDIRLNGYHVETKKEENMEYLCITSSDTQKRILEKLCELSSGLYYTTIRTIEAHSIMDQESTGSNAFKLWHDRLGHPGSTMMRRIITNSKGHPLLTKHIMLSSDIFCRACSQGKLVIRPSQLKVDVESPSFLQRIQGDICGPIHPPCGPFRYFMVLVDASTRWSHVCLLSTRNMAFARLLAQIIKLRAQFPDYPIKSIRLDNAGEFTSQTFDDYCMSLGIDIEHPVPHVHTQNGLAEALIKRLQLIARTLLMKTKLPISAWGYAILHAASLVRLRPVANNQCSPIQLVLGNQPNISHLKIFGCAVYVPIAPPQRTKMGPQRRLGIYVGFDSPSIIKYLEPLTGDIFTARFADCDFDETIFPPLGGEKSVSKEQGKLIPEKRHELSWNVSTLSHLDPHTAQCENEVRRIVHLQSIANQMPDAFNDAAKVTKSHIPAANAPARIDVHDGQSNVPANGSSAARLKRGRPLGSKDSVPRKRKLMDKMNPNEINREPTIHNSNAPKEGQVLLDKENVIGETSAPKVATVPESQEISINYTSTDELWSRNEMIIDDIFAFSVAAEIIKDDDIEPCSINECTQRQDWPKWKDAIQAELNSLEKRSVFGHIIPTPPNVNPVGYKWVFTRKRNEKNEISRYKARLVAQGFSQRPGIDYMETYSPVMDTITFRYLISLAVSEKLEMRLMDVITAYLYGELDTDIYMKVPEGFRLPEAARNKPRGMFSVKLRRSLYGLKQSGRMWYNRLSKYLLKEGYTNDPICPCVFIKKSESGFAIVAVYVDDMNLIGTSEELQRTVNYLKREFEMKDLGKTKYCLGLQIEHNANGILVHQSTYTEKVLKRFGMDKAHPLSTPMVVRSLDIKKDPYRPKGDDEIVLGPEVPYLSAIGALLYLAQCTRPDISFSVNLLARYSSAPTWRHWTGIKHVLRYLRGTTDMGLFYSSESTNAQSIIGYADAGYLSDPHQGRSQTGYVFTCGGTAISWRSTKQTLVATSSNHSEILALHEASRECVWLRSVIHHIRSTCALPSTTDTPTILNEDNAACIAQITGGYIKGDRTKHISPKFFYTHELQKSQEIKVRQIRSSDNLADLFTKSLPKYTFQRLVHGIGLRQLCKQSS
ncbi:Disease resistance protein CC-NBS-LRR class family [Prunus dulcis]|uniref:Disease resistance protein CC-NBS-LRR class family n=1 Tax=Prunus dulcis TaxID=3755 RepID=A0A4Y1RLH3_PRUDU|nr:Disease resistance protein CC-NBS-LRR class family [Prunus dulcis]